MRGDPFYVEKIDSDELAVKSALKNFEGVAQKFCALYGICVHFHGLTCRDVIHLYNRELKKINLDHKPNIYKRAAAMATWIIRLKPIFNLQFTEDNKIFPDTGRKDFARRHINEIFAMYYGLVQIRKARPEAAKLPNVICNKTAPGLPPFDEFLSNLRFRFLGVRQLAILLQLCCENSLPNDHPAQKTAG
jgi:hypothetical protein